MGDYFYSISICGIVCGLTKRLAPVRYRDILNLLCSVMLISVILQPVSFNKEITYTPPYNTDTLICKIYADELINEINKLLSESAYNAKVDNIYCECKEHKLFKYFIVAYSIL